MDNTVHGIDISHWNGAFDFAKAASENNKFCYAKATEGSDHVDIQYKRNKLEAPKHGILFGSYHFFRPVEDAKRQAEHFLSTIGPGAVGDLPPMFDWEVTDGVRNSQQIAGALTWLRLVEASFGKKPIIYTGPYFAKALGDLSVFKDYPLWIANYGVNHPKIPAPWLKYTFWQYSGSGGLDRDIYSGTLQELHTMAGVA